jgi:hypothetical protein
MSPFARPNADAHVGNFEDQAAGTTDIYQSIDEDTPSDSDYIVSPSEPSSEPYVCGLSTVTDPEAATGHIVRYRYAKNVTGGNQIDLSVELREGYVSEVSQGTLIASWAHTDISATAVTQAQTLSASEANAITDYADLFLRFVFDEP